MVGSHLGNIPLKFKSHWPKGSGGVSFCKADYSQFSIFSSGGHFVHRSKTVLAILVEGHLSNIPMKFKLNRPRGIGGVDVKRFFSSPEHEVLMLSYCDQSMSVVRRQQFVLKLTPSEPLGQCDSKFIGMLPRWLPTRIAIIVSLR